MILINLLPPEFRKAEPTQSQVWRNPWLLKGAGLSFLALTFFFYVQYLFNVQTLKKLQTRWPTIHAEAQRVSQIKTEIEGGIKSEENFLEHYVSSPFHTTQILSAVSELLPDSMWLVELKVSRKPEKNSILLKGLSHASGRHSSIQEIEKYLRDLKEKLPSDTRLVLTTSRQQKEKMELTLFTADFEWV